MRDSNGIGSARVDVTAGANTVDSTSLDEVFCSVDPLDAEFLHIKDTGPAYNIDGVGNNAGAYPSCAAPVKKWDLF